MRHWGWGLVLAGAVAAVGPVGVKAQIFPFHAANCCNQCAQPMAQCHCTRTRPVVQTHLRAEQVTTLRNVTETHVRNETYIEQTPVTTVENVTVDEGAYRMVWVPKPVTRQVAKTTVTQQVKSRAVPYQVMRQIPETTTRMVPFQTVHHVTETVPMAMSLPIAAPVISAAPCDTCGHSAAVGFGHFHAAPMIGHAPFVPTTIAPQTASGADPVMDGWQTIQPRRSAAGDHDHQAPLVPTPKDAAAPTPKTSGLFKPVRNGAAVWAAAHKELANRPPSREPASVASRMR